MATKAPKTTSQPQTQSSTPKAKVRPVAPAPSHQSGVNSQSLLQRAEVDPLSLTRTDLQRISMSVGQRAIQRLVNRPEVRQARAIPVPMPVFRPMAQVQAKLTVGPVGDKYEQEADRMASQVMRMAAPVQREDEMGNEEAINPLVQRASNAPAEPSIAESVTLLAQRSPLARRVPEVQRASEVEEEIQTSRESTRESTRDSMGSSFAPSHSFESQLRRTRGGGRPIPDNTRTAMESRMGADFSGVRLHTNQQAVQLSRQINAQAFTLGRDIYFGEGKSNLASGSGRRLLAHELTHTIQQGAAPVQRKRQTPNAGGRLQLSAAKPRIQRLLTSVTMSERIRGNRNFTKDEQRTTPAELSWWRRKFQSEKSQNAHLISRLKKVMNEINNDQRKKALDGKKDDDPDIQVVNPNIYKIYSTMLDLSRNDDELQKMTGLQLQIKLGEAEALQKGLKTAQRLRSPKLKGATAEFMGAVDEYHRVLTETSAGGLLQAPEFVLDQVFGKYEVQKVKKGKKVTETVKGASAGNLDVGVGDMLAAHFNLMMTTGAYINKLRQQNEWEVAQSILEYLPEIEMEKEYLYQGMKASRGKDTRSLADLINEGRTLAGKKDTGVLQGIGAKGDALPDSTPLGMLKLASIPGVSALDKDDEHLAWLQEPEDKKEESPDLSRLDKTRDLGKGKEGEVTLYLSQKVEELREGEAPEELADEEPKAYAVKTSRTEGRENLLKEYAAYKHVGRHRNLARVHGMAAIQFGQDKRAGMVMDFVKGPTGERAMKLLREKGKSGELSAKQYWGAIQFITRRLIDVIQHLTSKGIAHNDIKPENFMIDENGEPVLMDLGLHSVKGKTPGGTTPAFAPAELTRNVTSGEETDLFMVASTMLAGVEDWQQSKSWTTMQWSPNKGLGSMPSREEDSGRVAGETDGRDMEAEYTAFMAKVVGSKGLATVTIAEASRLPFIARPLLSDEAAKRILSNLRKDEEQGKKGWWEDVQPRWAPREAGQSAKKRQAAARAAQSTPTSS